MEIGLATMRRDGFAWMSRRVPDSPAHVVTAPITAKSGARIFINVEGATTVAPLKVELLDEFDRSLPGYSGEAAAMVSESGTRTEVVWSKPAIRITLPADGDAKFYALYVGGN